MVTETVHSFLIITTGNLPEAYFLAKFLNSKNQKVGILNIEGRTFGEKLRVLKRLYKKRGLIYLLDFFQARLFRKFYQDPKVKPFPDITDEVIQNMKKTIIHDDFSDPHSEKALTFVRNFVPDYILIAGAPILKSCLYGLAKHKAINRHLGLSPLYRGSDCPIWAMRNNDFGKIGFTIHVVAKKADAGDILLQKHVPIDHNHDFSQTLANISFQGSKGFVDVLEKIISGVDIPTDKQSKGGNHYPPITLSAVRSAHKNFKKYRDSNRKLP